MIEEHDTSQYIITEGTGDKIRHKVIPAQLAEYIRAHLHYFFARSNPTSGILRYIYRDGVYVQVSDEEFKGAIKAYVPPALHKPKDINDVFSLLCTDSGRYFSPDKLNIDENIINFQNGILDLSQMELIPHSHSYMSTVQIPCRWMPDVPPPEDGSVFDRYLDQLTGGDADTKELLLEFMGTTISNIPGYRAKKALFLIGEGNTGKSQLRSLLVRLIGNHNSASCSMRSLEERFGTSELYGKRLGGNGDQGFLRINELNNFKQLTGGDAIKCEFKGQGSFPFVFRGWLFFCANHRPLFGGDRGDHVYDRFMIVPCNNIVPEEQRDSQLCDKMYAEREYIICKAVHALKRFIARGYKFSEPACVREERAAYELENDTVLSFAEDCTEPQPVYETYNRTRKTDMYKAYVQWCKDNGQRAESSRTFHKTLEDKKQATTIKSGGYDFYFNIHLTAEAHNDLHAG